MKPAAAVALALAWQTTGAAQPPAFRAETRLVVVHATVRNARGELVTTLGRGAFTVYEDGKRQPITLWRNDDIPVSLGLLIDNSGSMRTLRSKVEAAALALVRASNPQDEVFVLNFNDKTRIDVPFTSDVGVLEAGIARVDSIGGTALRDAIDLGQTYLAQHGTRDRKVLLVITDGIDNASTVTRDRIETQASERDTVVFAVGVFGGADRARDGRHELDRLAERTGGTAFYPAGIDDIGPVALEIAVHDRVYADEPGARRHLPHDSRHRVGTRTHDRAHSDRLSGGAAVINTTARRQEPVGRDE